MAGVDVPQYRVVDPASGTVVTELAAASDSEVLDALSCAHRATGPWRATAPVDRAGVLERVAELLEERQEQIAATITQEMGKTLRAARAELDHVARIYRYYAEHGPEMLDDVPLETTSAGRAVVRKAPLGVLLGIMPWNFPAYQTARFAAPNLLAGNTVLIKPSPQCPLSAGLLQQVHDDAGVAPGAYVTLLATNDQVSDLIADDRVRGVSLTGSDRAGAVIAAQAGRHVKKAVLELGGSDAYVVLGADDLASVAAACAAARIGNSGQACNAGKRFVVLDAVFDEFLDLFVARMARFRTGDPTDPRTHYGPLASIEARDHLAAQVDDAVERGATLLLGGRPVDGPGAYYPPTVLTDVVPGMRAYSEELFGPVAVVHRASSIDDAVRIANDSPYGLGGAVFHPDVEVAQAVADRLDTGMVWINGRPDAGPELPFGGTKRSGFGRELGPDGIEAFLNRKLIHLPH